MTTDDKPAGAISNTQTAPGDDLEARWQLVLARYGNRLTDEQRADLRKTVDALAALTRELRRVPLTNADAPLDLAVPWRSPRRPAP